ncbi:uncharacterized protein LOC134182839 [Corticium candelabrum]|uniref:uncharacterized protein LOC134182839 n=1 Tax=Corticium candelabrum TaxID=121492 RepID=UPI002E26CA81|nr:uncharacterized protein LOC134182839 [Corticium candelabrum]
MAAFEFPTIDLRSFRVDNFAASILPEDAPSGYLPVMVKRWELPLLFVFSALALYNSTIMQTVKECQVAFLAPTEADLEDAKTCLNGIGPKPKLAKALLRINVNVVMPESVGYAGVFTRLTLTSASDVDVNVSVNIVNQITKIRLGLQDFVNRFHYGGLQKGDGFMNCDDPSNSTPSDKHHIQYRSWAELLHEYMFSSAGCKVLCEDTQASSASPLRPHTRATQLFIPDTEPIESPDEVQVPTASLEVQSNFYGFTYKDIEKDENLAKSREQESMDPSQKLNFNDSGSSGLVCAVGDSPSTDLVSHPPQELAVTQTPTTSRMPEASVKSKRKLLDRNQLLPFDGQEKPEWTDIQKLSKKSKRNQSSVKIESKPKRPKKCKEVVDGEGQCDVVLECDENESQQLLRKKDRNSLNLFEAPKKWRQANGLNHRPVLKSSSKKKGRKSGEVTQATNGSNKALKSTRSLVMTSVSSKDRELVVSVAQELGGFTVDSCVSESTTHVVFTQPRRTLNVLMGIARGCWLVSIDWVYKSVETGCWVEEKSYELDGAFPAAKVSREKRFASSGPYNSQIFASCPPIFISEDANPPVEHLSQLVALCGGKLTLSRRRENVLCVGKLASRGGVWLSEQWIMDCIAQGRLMPVTEYGLRDSTK